MKSDEKLPELCTINFQVFIFVVQIICYYFYSLWFLTLHKNPDTFGHSLYRFNYSKWEKPVISTSLNMPANE